MKPETSGKIGSSVTKRAGTHVTPPAALNSAHAATGLAAITREQFDAAGVLDLLELASAGGYGIMFGFNRTGGVVCMLFVGGEKTRAHLEDGTHLAGWVRSADEYLAADFAQERPVAYKRYIDTTTGANDAENAS